MVARVPRSQAPLAVLLCVALVAFASFGCGSSVRVRSAYDRSADFSKVRTFAMLEPNKPVHSDDPNADPFVLQRLRQLTHAALVARGMKPAPQKEADVLIGVLTGTQQRVEVFSRSYYGYGYGFPYRGPAFGYDVQRYDEGTVVIDLVDRKKNAVIWRGTGTRRLFGDVSDEELRESVDRVLSYYPPRAEE